MTISLPAARRRAAIALATVALVAPTLPAAAATPPAAPSGLAATIGSGIVALMWADNASDESGFEIERCTPDPAGCTFAPFATALPNQTAYADQAATLGVGYRYRVRAVNEGGVSAWSREARVPGSGLSLAGSPTAVLVASTTSGPAPLAITFDGGGSSALELATIVDWSWSFGDGSTASGVAVSHVYSAPGSYRVALTVTDSRGYAHLTATTITVTAPAPVLVAPTGLKAWSPIKRDVRLSWVAPVASSATQLAVQRCPGSTCTSFATVASLDPTATAWRDTAVRSGVVYRYRLVVSDAGGQRLATPPVKVRVR